MRRRSQDADRFEVTDVAERLAPYNLSYLPAVDALIDAPLAAEHTTGLLRRIA